MSPRLPVRAGTTGIALTLAAGVLLVAPTPAQAVVLGSSQSQPDVSFDAVASCPGVGPGDTSLPAVPFAADGQAVSSSASSSWSVTKNGNPADVVDMTGSITHSITATQANNSLSKITIDASGQVATNAHLGAATVCDTEVQASANDVGEFDLPSPKIVDVTVNTKGFVGVVLIAAPVQTNGLVASFNYMLSGITTSSFYLPAGHWTLSSTAGLGLESPTPAHAQPTSRSGSVHAEVVFRDPGTATTSTTGDAAKYVDLGATRDCAGGKLTATFKAKAGKGDKRKIKKATFYADGTKIGSVKKPQKKTTTVLSGIDPESNATVEVRLKLAAKGAGTVRAERSYASCA